MMLIGVISVVVAVCWDLGGLDEIRHIAMQGGRFDRFKWVIISYTYHHYTCIIVTTKLLKELLQKINHNYFGFEILCYLHKKYLIDLSG